jgi:hypothetical protein
MSDWKLQSVQRRIELGVLFVIARHVSAKQSSPSCFFGLLRYARNDALEFLFRGLHSRPNSEA